MKKYNFIEACESARDNNKKFVIVGRFYGGCYIQGTNGGRYSVKDSKGKDLGMDHLGDIDFISAKFRLKENAISITESDFDKAWTELSGKSTYLAIDSIYGNEFKKELGFNND